MSWAVHQTAETEYTSSFVPVRVIRWKIKDESREVYRDFEEVPQLCRRGGYAA